jgi:hypothetical protein
MERENPVNAQREIELIKQATKLFGIHDRMKAEFKQVESQLDMVVQQYANEKRIFGFRREALRDRCQMDLMREDMKRSRKVFK